MQVPAGLLGDRFGRKRILVIGILLVSGAALVTGLSGTLAVLALARLLDGPRPGDVLRQRPADHRGRHAARPSGARAGSVLLGAGRRNGPRHPGGRRARRAHAVAAGLPRPDGAPALLRRPGRPLRARSGKGRPGFARGARVPRRGCGRLPAARPVAPRHRRHLADLDPVARRDLGTGPVRGGRDPRAGPIGLLCDRPRDRRAARPARRGRAVRPPAAAPRNAAPHRRRRRDRGHGRAGRMHGVDRAGAGAAPGSSPS